MAVILQEKSLARTSPASGIKEESQQPGNGLRPRIPATAGTNPDHSEIRGNEKSVRFQNRRADFDEEIERLVYKLESF